MTDAVVAARPVAALARPRQPCGVCAASLVMLYPLLGCWRARSKPENEIFTSISLWPSHVDAAAYLRGWTGLKTISATSSGTRWSSRCSASSATSPRARSPLRLRAAALSRKNSGSP